MKLGVKFAPALKEKDVRMFEILEEKGIKVSGVELQLFPESKKEEVLETMDALEEFNLKFIGIHPPFPSFREEFEQWRNLPADYIVLHAGTRNTYLELPDEMKAEKSVVENLFQHGDKRKVLVSLIETSLVSDSLLLDIAHILYVYRKGMYWMPPWEQVREVGKKIRVVHAADGLGGKGVVPQNGGSQEFRALLKALFEEVPNAYYVGEPYGGHLHENKGHIENAIAFWKLWEEFKDGKL